MGQGEVEGEVGQGKAGWARVRLESKSRMQHGEVGCVKKQDGAGSGGTGKDRARWNREKQAGAG